MANQKNQKVCYFCDKGFTDIDYKDTNTLSRFINTYKKILPRRRTGVCSSHQRKLSVAIKHARIMALLPFTNK